jgi:DUF438 domain-containing protein
MDYTNRQYLIFPTNQLDKINFSKVLETSQDTVRKSVDRTKTFIKWEGKQPEFIEELTDVEGPYTHSQFLDILSTEEWTEQIQEEI